MTDDFNAPEVTCDIKNKLNPLEEKRSHSVFTLVWKLDVYYFWKQLRDISLHRLILSEFEEVVCDWVCTIFPNILEILIFPNLNLECVIFHFL